MSSVVYAFSFDARSIKISRLLLVLMPNGSNFLNFVSKALSQTDTRDSLTEILQYSARLVAGTFPDEELAARRVYKSLSEGRKIFRLLRFIPEISNLIQINDSDPYIQRLAITQSCAVIAFFVLDNWIYFLEIVKRKSRGEIRPLKLIKNRVSLLRIALSLTMTVAELRRLHQGTEMKSPGVRPVTYFELVVRFWHESLRLWLTVHKLHLLDAFMDSKNTELLLDKNRYDLVPGAVGLASALTGFLRRTVLKRDNLLL